MKIIGDPDLALEELKEERDKSLKRLISGLNDCVTDTHPLVFWVSDRPQRLGKRARRIFQEVDRGKHSIIVLMMALEETARLAERSVIALAVPFRRWAEELDRSPNFQIQPYTMEILFESVSLQSLPRSGRSSLQQGICVAH